MNMRTKYIIIAAVILVAVLSRFASFWNIAPFQGFTAMGAMAIFMSYNFRNAVTGLGFTLATSYVSSVLLNSLQYNMNIQDALLHSSHLVQMLCFALVFVIGKVIINKPSMLKIGGTAIAGSLVFFLVSNLFVWIGGGINVTSNLPLPKTFAGLATCYEQALPFLKFDVASSLLFSTVFFGLYWIKENGFSFKTAK
jgi:hypothetical protein